MTLLRFIVLAVPTWAAPFAGWCGQVLAEGSSAGDAARALAGEIQQHTGGGDGLEDWARSVVDGALERAGHAAREMDREAYPAPLSAQRNSARIARRFAASENSAETLVFMSLSVPAASWRQWAADAARTGSPLVLRGVGAGGLRQTVEAVGERLGGHDAGVVIDPRLFRLFGIERVPAVAVVPGGVPPCRSGGCSDDPAPAHDLVTGNIGLGAALETIAAEGGAGRGVARRYLERLGGSR